MNPLAPVWNMIRGLFANVNYVYMVEMLVILAIVSLLLYVFNALGLLKKPK